MNERVFGVNPTNTNHLATTTNQYQQAKGEDMIFYSLQKGPTGGKQTGDWSDSH